MKKNTGISQRKQWTTSSDASYTHMSWVQDSKYRQSIISQSWKQVIQMRMQNGSPHWRRFILAGKLEYPVLREIINQKLQTISLPTLTTISTKISHDTSRPSLKKQSGQIQILLSQKMLSKIAHSQTKKKHFSHNGSEKKKNSVTYRLDRETMSSGLVKIHAVNHGKPLKKTSQKHHSLR